MSLKDAKKAFYDAKKELEQLEAELPNFAKLLDDSKHAEQKLRGARAKTENLLDARSRSHAAKELLEQHHADIETQRAEVARLEATYQRERTLDKMAVHAKEAHEQRQAFDQAITAANTALGPLVNKMISAWHGWKQARNDFVATGRPLSRGFERSSWSMTTDRPDDPRILAELLQDLEDRGAPLDDALSPHDGWDMTVADRNAKPLARPDPFAYFLYEMMKHVLLLQEQAAQREAHRRKEEALEQPPSVTSQIFVSQEHGVEAIGRLGGAMGGLVLNSYREPSGRVTLTVKNEHLERCLDILKRHLPEGTFSVPGNGA
jgi:tetratricopeptide (TPR) repeat protein